MRVNYGVGINLYLDFQDKNYLEERYKISAPFWENPRQILTLRVIEDEDVLEREIPEESGFHIKSFPESVSMEEVERYEVSISKERFRDLVENLDISGGGYFVSRSRFDRVSIKYFDE